MLTATFEPAPFTTSSQVSLVGSDQSCMVDSYEIQVVCIEPGRGEVRRFGRVGEGPGEYQAIVGLAPLRGNRLGVVDNSLNRLTIIAPGHEVERTLPLGAGPWLMRAPTDTLMGVTALDFAIWIPSNEQLRREVLIQWLHPAEGVVRTETLVLPDTVPVTRMPLFAGAFSPEHGYAFLRMPYEIIRFTAGGEYLGRFTPEHYEPELPNQRDVAARAAGLRALFRTEPSASELRAYASEPKHGVLSGMALTFTADGLLWISSTRDRDTWSYIDVYHGRGTRWLGSVRVRDRLLGFDTRDGTLVTLVERQSADARSIAPYAIDWYDVTEWVNAYAGGEPTPDPAR